MNEMLFPEAALKLLRRTRYDPSSECRYEIMSGGLAWSDELLFEASSLCRERESWAVRYLMAYRASLIRGSPREDIRPPWNQLLRECPDWPGFRPERSSSHLIGKMDCERRRSCVGFLRLERDIDKAKLAKESENSNKSGN